MSRMLRLMDAGWASIRSMATHGCRHTALARLDRWLSRPDLPASIAVEANTLTGELYLQSECYPEARRHLARAARLDPTQARIHYLWGLAHEQDPHGCHHRAARRFRAALQREPNHTLYRAAYGRALVRCKQIRRGVRHLRTAAAAKPGDVSVVRLAVTGLLEARRFTLARRVLYRARFLNPRNSELKTLSCRLSFEWIQHRQRRTTRHRQEAEFAKEGGRVVLPFIRVNRPISQVWLAGKTRRDVVSLPQPHSPRLGVRRVDG